MKCVTYGGGRLHNMWIKITDRVRNVMLHSYVGYMGPAIYAYEFRWPKSNSIAWRVVSAGRRICGYITMYNLCRSQLQWCTDLTSTMKANPTLSFACNMFLVKMG